MLKIIGVSGNVCNVKTDSIQQLNYPNFMIVFFKQRVPPTGQNAGIKLKIIQKGIPLDTYKFDISNDILNGKIQMDEVEKALIKIKKVKHRELTEFR